MSDLLSLSLASWLPYGAVVSDLCEGQSLVWSSLWTFAALAPIGDSHPLAPSLSRLAHLHPFTASTAIGSLIALSTQLVLSLFICSMPPFLRA